MNSSICNLQMFEGRVVVVKTVSDWNAFVKLQTEGNITESRLLCSEDDPIVGCQVRLGKNG